ncbi:zinc finger protein Xfin [Scaptodrosophila lebanonensis]|uniref:Zinc finger protein Xfin n=1 Tax=Drosophila lebanonensis TaxID=7225 RepID=A0A6J2TN24_DROLE|nr:zinc finger protein Xfin [Scaptodrosophila lebanonensis]
MPVGEICRTCARQTFHFVELSTHSEKCANKSLLEVLRELTKLDLCFEHAEDMPQSICSECHQRLISAYVFVLDAQQAHEQLLSKLRASSLDETPIDIPIQVNIKTEIDIGEERYLPENGSSSTDINVTSSEKKPEKEDNNMEDAVHEDDYDDHKPLGTRRSLRKNRNREGIKEQNEAKTQINEEESPIKRRRGRPALYDRTESLNESGRHACDVCGKTFSWFRDMQRHARVHFEQASYVCEMCGKGFLRKDKYTFHLRSHKKRDAKSQAVTLNNEWRFAERLYSSGRLKLVECKLCGLKCQRVLELRQHLSLHANIETLDNLTMNSDIVQVHYNQMEMHEIKHQICSDIASQNMEKYYAVVNAHGYELCLSDSDEEPSVDDDNSKYYCEPCNLPYTRKHRLIRHTLEEHSQERSAPPQSCSVCHIGFVCSKLLKQHMKSQCNNALKRLVCSHCPGKFMWQQNLVRHACTHHKSADHDELGHFKRETAGSPTDSEPIASEPVATRRGRGRPKSSGSVKLQCSDCEKVFMWRKDLNRHMRMHQPNRDQFECAYCDRKFHRKDGLKSHMRVHNEELAATTDTNSAALVKREAVDRMPVVLTQLAYPNGCKQIQCMICLTKHTKISDLRTHLRTHQYVVNLQDERSTPAAIASISCQLYPELALPLLKQELVERIMKDVAQSVELERFYSITNEAGNELSLDSSETDSDSEGELVVGDSFKQARYVCELCRAALPRKHEIYAHQLEFHEWQEASNVCPHCNARFVDAKLLEHHYRTLCRNTQKRFLCKKCPLRFRWKGNLRLHTNVAHQEVHVKEDAVAPKQAENTENTTSKVAASNYNCADCKRSFSMQKDLTRHVLMHGKDANIYRCRWCARRFYRLANLLQHIERHGINAAQLPYAEALVNVNRHANGQKCILCKVCDCSFSSIAELRAHLQNTPAGTHFDYGSLQNYSITNELGYELHLDDSETDEDSKAPNAPPHYTCSICKLRVRRKYELYQHQQAMHPLERITDGCPHCIFKSVSPALLEHHKRVQCENTEKQLKCSKCDYKFMWETNLLLHMQLQHSGETESSTMPLEQKTIAREVIDQGRIFQCSNCPCKYNRKDRLTAHIKKMHTQSLPSTSKAALLVDKHQNQPKRFLCAFCGKAVSSSSNLIIHMRRHTGEKPFKCEYCEMAFPRSSDLQCHRRKHTGERPHVCTVCQKGFSRSYKLRQHMRIHNGERPYKCSYCEKSFTQSNDLTLHIRRHTGERPYPCGICGERFIQGTALKNHRMQQGHYEAAEEDTAEEPKGGHAMLAEYVAE